jgi:DNA-binding NarL/FixJ family response regulator
MMELLYETPDDESFDRPLKPGAIRIILADSQSIYRVGTHKIFALENDIDVVAQTGTLDGLREATKRRAADVLLIEGGLIDGAPNVLPELLDIAPGVRLIVQDIASNESQTVELYRNGVRGIISRAISPDLLVRCVRRIAAGETWIENHAVAWIIEAYRAQAVTVVDQPTQPRLSPKETAIIACITQGKRNKEIAFQLETSEQVIKNYLRKIYDKLGVSDRLELALYAIQRKMVQREVNASIVDRKVLAG